MQKFPWSVHTVTPYTSQIVFHDIRAGWEQYVMLSSDRHHDNLLANWKAEKYHLEKARRLQAPIIEAGDLFCAMQGKWDPRSDMSQLRPEHKRPDYLDAIVETAADFYSPYADNFAVIARGNHETTQVDRHGYDLTKALVTELNRRNPGIPTLVGGYGGWVWFQFKIRKTIIQSKKLKYYHGIKGGGRAYATRGTLNVNRLGIVVPDADIVHTGHSHNSWVVSVRRERMSQGGFYYTDYIHFVRTPGYKDEWQEGGQYGWAIERDPEPNPIGCIWIKFYLDGNRICIEPTVDLL